MAPVSASPLGLPGALSVLFPLAGDWLKVLILPGAPLTGGSRDRQPQAVSADRVGPALRPPSDLTRCPCGGCRTRAEGRDWTGGGLMRAAAWLTVAALAAAVSVGGIAADQQLHIAPAPATVSEVAPSPTSGSTSSADGASAGTPSTPGDFGARVQDVPASWPVHGCEVVQVDPGGTAASLGLVGATQRTDPVGDVVATVQDTSAAGAPQPVASCAALTTVLAGMQSGDSITVAYYHRAVGALGGKWVPETASGILAGSGILACPPPLVGTITPSSTGNRIQLQIDIRGPHSGATYPAVLDTGADQTIVPDAYLRALGFKPSATTATAGLVPGTQTTAYVYRIPGKDILVDDQGRYVPLATGTVIVWGIPNESGIWLGPTLLERGLKLTTAGRQWTLNVPCLQ